MTILLVSGSLLALGVLHLKTGRSPFHWAARLCIVLDAALICGWRATAAACFAWWNDMPATIGEVRRDVTGMCAEVDCE